MRNNDKTLARQIALSKEYMWQNITEESKQLLGILGVPYIESPASAESQCAYLVKKGVADYSNSQDFDSLLFGCPQIIQNLSKSLRRKIQGKWQYQKIQPVSIDLQKNLKNLGLTIFQLVDIGILIGSDYFPGIKGIGPKKALQLIRKHESLENIVLKEYDNYELNNLNHEIIKKIRKIFLFPEINDSVEVIHWNTPNKPQVINLLCKDHHLNKERVIKNLDRLIINYEKCREYFIHQKKSPKMVQLKIY